MCFRHLDLSVLVRSAYVSSLNVRRNLGWLGGVVVMASDL